LSRAYSLRFWSYCTYPHQLLPFSAILEWRRWKGCWNR
jgi:hypothetical protein